MNAHEIAKLLQAVIEVCEDIPEDFCPVPIRRVETYREAGMLTRDAGLVLDLEDGTQFQVTVVQTRSGRGDRS